MTTTHSTLVYTTTTAAEAEWGEIVARDELRDLMADEEADPHCFVCGRHTDHFAEHDDLVEAGLASYDLADGTVHRTEAWDDGHAAAIVEATWQATKLEMGW